jgi:hypothetical protein
MQQQYPTATGRQKSVEPSTSVVTEQAKEIARAGTEQVKEIGQTTKERALREIDTRRMRIAGEVEKLAGTLERHGSESETAMPIFDLAATAARTLSGAMRDRSTEELLQRVARNPMAILAGSFALGFFTIRLFRA